MNLFPRVKPFTFNGGGYATLSFITTLATMQIVRGLGFIASEGRAVGVANEAREGRHPEPLPYSNDLRLRVRGPERNPRGANLTLACPIRDAMNAYDDPPDGIGRARTPRG